MIRRESLDILNNGYKEIYPFPHIVIDNFLEVDFLQKILGDSKLLNSKDAYYKNNIPSPLEYNKFAFKENLGKNISELFKYLVSKDFIDHIEKLTNIKGIISEDLTLAGAGLHRIYNKGYLAIHTDFNTYNHNNLGKLDRRINLLLYLNPIWKESYKGDLWLCNNRVPIKKILPILNRCVIFNTTHKSYHGHPERLCVPNNNIYRESLALYYYTKNINDPFDFEGEKQHNGAIAYPHFFKL